MAAIDEGQILQEIFKRPDIQKLIIFLNTEKQLFEKGQDSRGMRLDDLGGGYSINTIYGVPGQYAGKIEKGQPINRVTLKDSGEFYKSWKVFAPQGANYVEIIANPMKNGKDINEEWGGHVIGLDSESIRTLIDEIKTKLADQTRQQIRKA